MGGWGRIMCSPLTPGGWKIKDVTESRCMIEVGLRWQVMALGIKESNLAFPFL